MKSKIILLASLYFFSAEFLPAREIQAYLTYSTFLSPDKGTYLETYLSVIGNSTSFIKNEKGKFQGRVEVALIFKQGVEIKSQRKYVLLSPEIDDTIGTKPNFIDQQRISLDNGLYDFEISISDKNKTSLPFVLHQKITLDHSPEKINISGIELLESYKKSVEKNILTKSGYDLIPYVSNFFPSNMKNISFYAEVYNMNKQLKRGEKFVFNYFIESFESHVKLNNFNNFLKQNANMVNIILAEIPIKNLASGNYNLVIEIKNKENLTLAEKRLFFQRKNPEVSTPLEDLQAINLNGSFVNKFQNKDTLSDYIKSLWPISSFTERNYTENHFHEKDLELMRQFFLNYWKKRNELNPEQAWIAYNLEVRKVNNTFGTQNRKGYATDRGRVYLQYGPPDQRTEALHEPSTYPYEIWQYYKLVDQTNKKFVFYNPDLVTNNYTLIYSNARGEINNSNWQEMIRSGSEDPDGSFGNKLMENFNNPR